MILNFFKTFDPILVLTLIFIAHSAHSPKYDSWSDLHPDHLCLETDDLLDSTFTLSGDVFFKFSDRIYRLANTFARHPFNMNDQMWKYTSRYLPMETLLRLEGIDLNKPIFAFDYQFNYNKTCEGPTIGDYTYIDDECETFIPEGFPVFVCLYGYKESNDSESNSVSSWAFTYAGFYDFYKINNANLSIEVSKFCQHQLDYKQNTCRKVLTGWSDMPLSSSKKFLELNFRCIETKTGNTMSMSLNISLKSIEDINMQIEYQNVTTVTSYTYLDQITLFLKIEFHRCYFVFGFHYDTHIIWEIIFGHTFKFEDTSEYEREMKRMKMSDRTEFNQIRSSLALILRCPNYMSYQSMTQKSLEFCKQAYFDSIFNLGTDIYFQNEGRFWRYDSIWDKSEAKAANRELFMNFRFDSHLSALLDKYFDIGQRIVGFSIDLCLDNDCTNLTQKMIRRGMACIFGKDKVEHRNTFKTFEVTSAGLKEYQNESAHNLRDLCSKTNDRFHILDPVSNHLSVYVAFISSGINQYKYQLFANYINTDSEKITSYKCHLVIFANTSFQVTNCSLVATSHTPAFDGAFLYKEEWFFYEFNRKDWKIHINQVNYKYNFPERPGPGYEPKFEYVKLIRFNYFNCKDSPDNRTTHSVVTIQDPYQWICNPIESPLRKRFSVFNIGEYVYFQMGQRFYRYLDEFQENYKPGFVYDKQVSDILNDIFDTTEKVIGYSVFEGYFKNKAFNQKKYYSVVLIGKPRLHLTEKFKKQFIFNWFVKLNHPLAPLIPMFRKRPGVDPINTVENYCKYYEPSKPCLITITSNNLKALGFLHEFDDLDLYEETTNTRSGLFVWVSEENKLYFSPNGTFLYRNPLQTDTDLYSHSISNAFKEVYGVFQLKTKNEFFTQLNLLGLSKSNTSGAAQVPTVYTISSVDKTPHVDNPFTIYKRSTHRTDIDKFFKCQIENRPSIQSNDISDKPFNSYVMLFIFIEMIIVLIALIIIVVLLAVNRNRIR